MTLEEFFAPERTPAEQAFQDSLDQLDRELDRKVAEQNAYLFAMLNQIDNPHAGPEPEMPAHMQRRAPTNITMAAAPEPVDYVYVTRKREDGKIEELLPPGTSVERGDFITDEGVWRVMKLGPQPANPAPVQVLSADELDFLAVHLDEAEAQPAPAPKSPRLVSKPDDSRYDRAFVACRNAEADFNEALAQFGPTDERTIEASGKATKARNTLARVRKQDHDHPDLMRKINWIDAQRRTDEGRTVRNKGRRKRDKPNADLSGMTDDQRRDHTRAMEREKKRRQRAEAKAAKAG